jgi:hypothetical protein
VLVLTWMQDFGEPTSETMGSVCSVCPYARLLTTNKVLGTDHENLFCFFAGMILLRQFLATSKARKHFHLIPVYQVIIRRMSASGNPPTVGRPLPAHCHPPPAHCRPPSSASDPRSLWDARSHQCRRAGPQTVMTTLARARTFSRAPNDS